MKGGLLMDNEEMIIEFLSLLDDMDVDLDDLGLDVEDLEELDFEDLNNILSQIDIDDEDDDEEEED